MSQTRPRVPSICDLFFLQGNSSPFGSSSLLDCQVYRGKESLFHLFCLVAPPLTIVQPPARNHPAEAMGIAILEKTH